MSTRSLRLLSVAALLVSSFACDQAQKAAGSIAEPTPAAPPAEPPKPAGLTIHYVPPDIGMKVKADTSTHIEFEMKVTSTRDTKSIAFSQDEAFSRTSLVTSTSDGLITGARVSYDSASRTKTENGEEKKELRPVTGREYEAKWHGDDVAVTDTSGRKPSAEETEIVKAGAQGLQKYGVFVKALPTGVLMPGQTFDVPDSVWRDVTAFDQEQTQIGNSTTKLDEIRQQDGHSVGVFSTSFSLAGVAKKDIGVSANITGQLIVDADTGATLSADFSGPMTLTATDKTMKMTGLGKFESHAKATVER